MAYPAAQPGASSLAGKIITQIVALVGCVVIPAAVTAIAPVSRVKFERQGDRVTARAETCLLFFIPFRVAVVDPVTGIDQRTNNGSVTLHRRSGGQHNYTTRSDAEGFLVIQGPNRTAEVSVSPVDLESVAEEAEAFLKDPRETQLKLFLVANWKFSVLGGGLVSLLTVLYVGGCAFGLGRFLLRGLGLAGKGKAAAR